MTLIYGKQQYMMFLVTDMSVAYPRTITNLIAVTFLHSQLDLHLWTWEAFLLSQSVPLTFLGAEQWLNHGEILQNI